jgi:hypothetical protein
MKKKEVSRIVFAAKKVQEQRCREPADCDAAELVCWELKSGLRLASKKPTS